MALSWTSTCIILLSAMAIQMQKQAITPYQCGAVVYDHADGTAQAEQMSLWLVAAA